MLLLVAQLFGLPLGFGCLCDGDFRLVSGAVCEADVCHLDDGHHEEHSHHGVPCGDTQHEHGHQMVTDSLQALEIHAVKLPPVMGAVTLPVCETRLTAAERPHAVERRDRRRRDESPPAILAKRSMVLLV